MAEQEPPETEEELKRAGALRHLKVLRMFEAPRDRTQGSSTSQNDTPKTSRLPADGQLAMQGVADISSITAEKKPPAKPKGKFPTAQEYAEHLAGRSLSPEEIQPAQPSLAKLRKDQSTK